MLEQLANITAFEWITLSAVILGPILAVVVTREIDRRREKRTNRLAVFKVLMRTRGTRLNPEHVGALNLVEIEFYKEKKVSDALETYFDHLNGKVDERWLKASDHLFTKLLSEMAKSLGYKMEQLQILTGGYAPQGWADNENMQAKIQTRLVDLLEGRAGFPVVPYIASGNIQAAPSPTEDTAPPGFPPKPSA